MKITNRYLCPVCSYEWSTVSTVVANELCPTCSLEIVPERPQSSAVVAKSPELCGHALIDSTRTDDFATTVAAPFWLH